MDKSLNKKISVILSDKPARIATPAGHADASHAGWRSVACPKCNRCRQAGGAGFSLVELMAVIAIIGIMAAVITVSFSGSRATTRLKAAQNEVASAIKLAQSYALQGKIPAAGVKPSAYGFEFTNNQNYRIFYVTGGAKTSLENYSLADKGVTLTSPLANSTFTFDVPNGNLGGNSGTLTFTYGGTSRQIDVSSGGAVVER